MRRPLLQVALLYVTGILLAAWTPPLAALFVPGFLLLAACAVFERARPWLLCPLLVLAGWINAAERAMPLSPHDLRPILGSNPAIATVRGVLAETPRIHSHRKQDRETFSTTARLDVESIRLGSESWQPADGRVVILTSGQVPEDFFGGQVVEIEGVFAQPDHAFAPGLFDYRAYLKQLGIYYELKADGPSAWRIISSPARAPLADRFCAWARKTLAHDLPSEDRALHLEWALTLGWKAALTDEVSEPFIRASTYHIFAVDGLRIAIVSGILITLLRALRVPRAWWAAGVIPLIAFYAQMTGWPASAVRAIAMAAVVLIGWTLNRPSDLVNSLFAAALFILVWEPRELFQAGFQLSFFVVLCIILIHPFFDALQKRLLRGDPLLPDSLRPGWRKFLRETARWPLGLLLASIAAWLGSIPLVAYYFHLITPLSGPANLPAVPLCVLVLVSNLVSLLLGAWFPFASALYNHAGWACMRGIEITSQWSANWPGAFFYLPAPGLFTIGLYYLILLTTLTGWLFRGPRKSWKIAGAGLLTLAGCLQWAAQSATTELAILPLRGGYSAFLRLPGWRNDWLIDCGNQTSADTVLKPFLRAQGVNRLAHLALTHGEVNYTGGAALLCDLFQPARIHHSALQPRSPSYRTLENKMAANPAWQPPWQTGDHPGPWTVLHPGPADHFPRAEDGSLVLRGDFGGTRVLLLSGLGPAGQRALLERTNDLRADIVVAGLPGAGEPLIPPLLSAIQPRLIIITDAKDPTPKRAPDSLRQRLSATGVPVLYTRETDAIVLSLRPGHWRAKGMDGTQLNDVAAHPMR